LDTRRRHLEALSPTMASSALKDDKTAPSANLEPSHSRIDDVDDVPSLRKGDLLDLESVDPVLNAKMRLVNDAIDEIGFTGYQAKLFVLNGFGYVGAVLLSRGREHGIVGGGGRGRVHGGCGHG
jgi:hypothetical protein